MLSLAKGSIKSLCMSIDKIIKRLDQLGKQEQIELALDKSRLLVENDAKKFCPVGDGQLRLSIRSERDGLTAAVGTNLEYAPYVHQGTGIYAMNGDGRKTPWSYQDIHGEWHTTIGQEPNPFLFKALDTNRKQILQIFKDEL